MPTPPRVRSPASARRSCSGRSSRRLVQPQPDGSSGRHALVAHGAVPHDDAAGFEVGLQPAARAHAQILADPDRPQRLHDREAVGAPMRNRRSPDRAVSLSSNVCRLRERGRPRRAGRTASRPVGRRPRRTAASGRARRPRAGAVRSAGSAPVPPRAEDVAGSTSAWWRARPRSSGTARREASPPPPPSVAEVAELHGIPKSSSRMAWMAACRSSRFLPDHPHLLALGLALHPLEAQRLDELVDARGLVGEMPATRFAAWRAVPPEASSTFCSRAPSATRCASPASPRAPGEGGEPVLADAVQA